MFLNLCNTKVKCQFCHIYLIIKKSTDQLSWSWYFFHSRVFNNFIVSQINFNCSCFSFHFLFYLIGCCLWLLVFSSNSVSSCNSQEYLCLGQLSFMVLSNTDRNYRLKTVNRKPNFLQFLFCTSSHPLIFCMFNNAKIWSTTLLYCVPHPEWLRQEVSPQCLLFIIAVHHSASLSSASGACKIWWEWMMQR